MSRGQMLRSVHKCACTSCKRARARYIANAHVFNSCARIYGRIFMKFETLFYKIDIDHHIKFHKDLSFRCGDICKTISTFWILSFSMYFPHFHSFITYFILAISRSNFAQIQWSWTFFNSQDDELFKNVQDFRIWVKFDQVIVKKLW